MFSLRGYLCKNLLLHWQWLSWTSLIQWADIGLKTKTELDANLRLFYAEARNKDGENYSRSKLLGLRNGLNRYLNNLPYKKGIHIATDPAFQQSNQMLDAKLRPCFIWSRVPETTLLPSYPGRANFSLNSLKDSSNRLYDPTLVVSGGETTRLGELSGRRDNFFSYKHFGSPTWDNSRCVESHVFLKLSVLKHKFTLEKQNKLNKAHTDRMNDRNSNEERFLKVWILNSFMNI